MARTMVPIANAVRDWRQRKGWTQEQLAQAASVTRQTIHAIETRRYVPSLPVAFRIARAFGVSFEQVFWPTEQEE